MPHISEKLGLKEESMRSLGVVFCLFISCFSTLAWGIKDELRERLEAARDRWRAYSQFCPNSQFPSKMRLDGRCDDGDSVLFNGLLCLSGEESGCDGVRRAQDDDGQWWRSPLRVGGGGEEYNSFSRDMAMGVLAYLLATGDQTAAERWLYWLETHRKAEKIKGMKTPMLTQFCENGKDGTCIATPGFWAFAADVWNHYAWELTGPLTDPYRDFLLLGKFADVVVKGIFGGLDGFSDFEIKQVPIGYQLHLKAAQIFLYQSMGLRTIYGTFDVAKSARMIYERDRANPFFAYLHKGATDDVAEDLLRLCPAEGYDAERFQWSWERDSQEEAWRESMGWDCVFLANLLLRA
jgi:hypothetical protein